MTNLLFRVVQYQASASHVESHFAEEQQVLIECLCDELQVIQTFEDLMAQVSKNDSAHLSVLGLKCIVEPKSFGHELIE